jgi:hypothetical protein
MIVTMLYILHIVVHAPTQYACGVEGLELNTFKSRGQDHVQGLLDHTIICVSVHKVSVYRDFKLVRDPILCTPLIRGKPPRIEASN